MLVDYALGFSAANGIVESNEWANLIPETGLGGTWVKGMVHSKESIAKSQATKKANGGSSGERNPRWGVTLEEETKNQISESLKEYYSEHTSAIKGTTRSKESNDKISKTRKERFLSGDIVHSKEANESRSKILSEQASKMTTEEKKARYGRPGELNAHFGKKQKMVTCPYCGKTGGNGGMITWHFDKCKNKDSFVDDGFWEEW